MILRAFISSAISNGYHIVNKIFTLNEAILIASRIAILNHNFAVCLSSIMAQIMVYALYTMYTIKLLYIRTVSFISWTASIKGYANTELHKPLNTLFFAYTVNFH